VTLYKSGSPTWALTRDLRINSREHILNQTFHLELIVVCFGRIALVGGTAGFCAEQQSEWLVLRDRRRQELPNAVINEVSRLGQI